MYNQRITTVKRGAIVIMIDLSASMKAEVHYYGDNTTKADMATIAVNQLIDELLLRCRRFDVWQDYFDLCIVGYSGSGVVPLLSSELEFVPITSLLSRRRTTEVVLRHIPTREGVVVTPATYSRWINPTFEGKTPMNDAFRTVTNLVRGWCRRRANVDSFPPLVFNITDGQFTDATTEEMLRSAERLTSTGTTDGNTLLMNIYYATPNEIRRERGFFLHPANMPLPEARGLEELCRMASEIPEVLYRRLGNYIEPHHRPPFKALCYNSSPEELINFLSIGTTSIVFGR